MTSTAAAYATYRENVPLFDVVKALGKVGLHKEDICVLLSPEHPMATAVRESNPCAIKDKTLKAMNLLSELGAALIPTFGFFVRSRRFFRALGVERNTIPGSGLPGALLSLGFSRKAVDHFQGKVQDSVALMYVACAGVDQTHSALEVLRATGGEEAGLIESDTSVPAFAVENALPGMRTVSDSLLCQLPQ